MAQNEEQDNEKEYLEDDEHSIQVLSKRNDKEHQDQRIPDKEDQDDENEDSPDE